MSAHSSTPIQPERLKTNVSGLATTLLVVGVLGLVAAGIGAVTQTRQFAHSFLWAFTFFYTIAIGSFFWTILHHAVDADWSVIVRRQFENVSNIFWILAVAFAALALFCGPQLWRWMDPQVAATDPVLPLKQGYLNVPFFTTRAILYFVFFIFAAWYYRRLSTAQDVDGNPVLTCKMRKWSYLCIPLMAVSLTFSAFDWLMGLNFHWFSTMWGVYIFAGAVQSSMATVIIICWLLRRSGHLKLLNSEHAHIMGKLLLAFTIFWAYIAFSQYMLIWYANIPEETVFFTDRYVGNWRLIGMFLVVGHFVFPFIFLLTQAVKKSFATLSIVAFWLLFMHAVDLYWIILPQMHPQGASIHWLDIASWVGLAGVCGYGFLYYLRSAELFPARDPRLTECVKITN
jgi:hypothetical protein